MRVTTVRPNLTQLTRLCFVNAYLVPEDDGLTLVDTMIGGSGNPRCPLVGTGTWDRATANATAARLAGRAPAALAAGHGPVVADPAAAIERALAAAGVARAEAA